MALNPNTIKALFGKLAPYADDVAKGVANYGDDAARLVTDYGDDVVDDFTRLTSYVNRHNAKSLDVPTPVKTALQAGKLNDLGFSNTPPQGVLAKLHSALDDVPVDDYTRYKTDRLFNNAVDNAGWRGNVVEDVATTDWLGQGRAAEFNSWNGPVSYVHPENGVSVRVPEIPLSSVVSTSSVRRPHKNTALARWFESVKGDPSRAYDDGVRDVISKATPFDEDLYFSQFDDLPF